MAAAVPPFRLFFEIIFLESYQVLEKQEKKAVDKAVTLLAANPRHPSMNVHKARDVNAKYSEGGNAVFIAYATRNLRVTFEYGPEPGMIAFRNCGHHDECESKI
jgi:hypothetical protein